MNSDKYDIIKTAQIAVDGTSYHFDKLYDYVVPVEKFHDVFVGQRVIVPFGKGNQKKQGLILSIKEYHKNNKPLCLTEKGIAIKPIADIIDKERIINHEMIKIIVWLKRHTFCCYFDAIRLVIPYGYNISLIKKYKLSDALSDEVFSRLSEDEKTLINIFETQLNSKNQLNITIESLTKNQQKILKMLISKNIIIEREIFKRKIKDSKSLMIKISNLDYIDQDKNCKLTQKQQKVIDILKECESASVKEVIYFCGVTKSVLDKLTQKNITSYFEVERYRSPYGLADNKKNFQSNTHIRLNSKQEEIFNNLKILIDDKKPNIALLRGVTGSGKTLIFINLIKYVISLNKSVILLVPEISLTPQMISLLEKNFGSLVAVIHSSLSLSERLDEWKRIKSEKAKIILGTRSAIFAPTENVGLIIMDEEQESSYKSENTPRYHARDIAKLRAFYNNALFLMASATPSISTYYNIKKNNFNIFELDQRYNNISLPTISVVDMNKERQKDNLSFFSQELIDSIEETLTRKQQSIIFINRRGYNTIVRCDECGKVETCPNCSTALTYHKANNKMLCHYCGYIKDAVKKCVNCGSFYLRYLGTGTQKIETQLATIFPHAKILRLDSDTTMTKFSHDKYFQDFLDNKYDILIGTQMIAKGLNFPNVTLVGVIDADRSLYSNDYRGHERTYNLITQVIGRSGRGNVEGKAIIQTDSCDNNIFDLIVSQKYEEFYNQEILSRKKLVYPPFCNICAIGIVSNSEELVVKIGNQIFNMIKKLVSKDYQDVKIKMFGPVPEVISKINNKFRYKIFVKHKDNKRFRQLIHVVLTYISKQKQRLKVNVFIDKI